VGQILEDKRGDEKKKGIIIKTRIDVTKESGEFDSFGISSTEGGFQLFAALISNSDMDDCQ
jgi:hypothetical protein